ncbi:MAG: YeiH family protein [Prevotellaceae bacterium]|nr:YeiH family protein [Prevotella sp.]MDD7257329.1 YeiH family protein [Prevotellaceae bacterium]MDY6131064.1 YeiH family protein [Prevotella sp.]
MKFSEQRSSMLHGVLLITLFSCAAFYIGGMNWVKALSLSPMVVGIILGMLYANSLRNNLPETWVPGIAFCSKRILRFGIILYGFKLTFQDVMAVGLPAIVIDAIVVVTTICLGVFIGNLLKMDRSIALLTSCGSAICGAAAVLGVDGAIRPKPYKTAVAVATVVIFGTLSMFLYPILYRAGVFDLPVDQMGIFTGATVHEVAHVVGAGNAMGAEVSNSAIIVKMIRVMMLVPVLLVIAFFVARNMAEREGNGEVRTEKSKINIPWFAILFLVVIGFNSLNLLPESTVAFINDFDTFLLTMAMTALGAETSIDKFRKAGFKPFLLAVFLYSWLVVGGYWLVKYLTPIL